MIKLPPKINDVINKLERSGFEAFIVGGCVRDFLLNQQPKDFDIATSANPQEVMAVFSDYKVIETGLKHGTVTVMSGGVPVEITTYRTEADYSDNRHPDKVNFTKSLIEDVARRDFTMNAIAYNESLGLIDHFDGEKDIKNRLIRCVGDADKRFNEDALRILRALRFSSVLGFDIESETKRAIFANKELLLNISAERIALEIVKLLCGINAKQVLIDYLDVIGVILPELLIIHGFEQKNKHHIYDVFMHSVTALENIEPTPVLRIAALLHDIGKPACFSLDQKGTGHFYGHAFLSAQMADSILKRLKFDNATRILTNQLIKAHDDEIESNERAVKRALNKLTPEVFFKLLKLKRADNSAQNPDYHKQDHYDKLEAMAKDIIKQKECFSLKDLSLKGDDIVSLGISSGKEVGRILDSLLNEVIDGNVENSKEELIKLAKTMIK